MKLPNTSLLSGIATLAFALLFASGCQQGSQDAIEPAESLNNNSDSVSYSIGYDIGNSFNEQSAGDINMEAFVKGFKNGYDDTEPMLAQDTMRTVLKRYQQKMMKKRKAEQMKASKENKQKAEEFFKENLQKEGVQETDSGLQYKVLEEGDGEMPGPKDKVRVHYKGTLLDGTVFDSSHKRGKPAEFQVNQVIKGWQEALQMMSVGGKWKIFVPSELAYGQRGAGSQIGPNETLIFEVELLEIL